MFIDARELTQGQAIDADLCIVGAGAAGITLAREFIGRKERVVVLESGGFEFDERTQSLATGRNVGLWSFGVHVNRLRYFGGTTNHWAGHCRPLDPIDFEQREWMPHSGWPIARAELEPFYLRAQPICGLGAYEYENLDFWLEKTGLPALPLDPSRLKTAVYNQSPPTRFGQEYREELKAAKNVTVYLNANVLQLQSDEAAVRVRRARVACIDGPRFEVTARRFVLAAGGMENARLLLLSDEHSPSGLGNANDLVGRYFMDHVLLRPGADLSLTSPSDLRLYHNLHDVAGGRMFGVLAATEELLRREKIANFRIHLVRSGPRYRQDAGGVFAKLDDAGGARAQPPSIGLHIVLEPTPLADSRLTLGREKDLFGQPQLHVNWQVADQDRANIRRAMELAALEFGRMGMGRAWGEIFQNAERWPGHMEAGKHHCGTTRMTDSPNTGVVDANCRLHGVTNLYIAGSSVFPTIGYANPTLTIVALTLRLADHLKESRV